MKNTATKICIGIVFSTFALLVIGVILTALGNPDSGGSIAGVATALCCGGWFLALRNLKKADQFDFSSEQKPNPFLEKFLGNANEKPSDEVSEEQSEIPESEWL